MIHDIHFPQKLSGRALDFYLERGWFRMGHTIFTTHLIYMNGQFYPVHWLRIVLPRLEWGRRQRQLSKHNSSFQVHCRPFVLTSEIEDLYSKYRLSVDFSVSPTVMDFLHGNRPLPIFNSYAIEVRDAGKLIAIGIFDCGHNSIAGIMNFYDPDYAPYSPGKYLMLLKAEWARDNGHQYYYPGYLAIGMKKFDYKLWLQRSATEYYDPRSQVWLPVQKNDLH